MRRILFILLACAFCTLASAADIKVTKGDVKVLKSKAEAVVEYDYSHAKWEKDQDFKTWCGEDFDVRVQVIASSFMESFNDHTKGMTISADSSSAAYKLAFDFDNFESHQAAVGWWGQGKLSVTGVLHVINLATGEEECTIAISKYGDSKDFTYTDAMSKTFKGLAKELVKLKK